MPFGLSFGAKKQSSKTTTDINKNELTTGSQSQATTGVTQGATNTSQTGQVSTTGGQQTQQNVSQSQTGQETGRTSGTVSSLSGDIQSTLSDTVKRILSGGVNDANIASLSNAIGGMTNFNADEFVRQNVMAARQGGENALQENVSARQSQIGGTAGTNSMAALLAMRGRNDLEANLAGVEASSRATAEGIANKNLETAVGAQGSLVSQGAGAADVLKGATTTTDMATLTNQLNQLLGTTTGDTKTQESQSSTQSQQTQTLQIINELVNALTNQNVSTIGTENSKTKGKSMGGGISAGI